MSGGVEREDEICGEVEIERGEYEWRGGKRNRHVWSGMEIECMCERDGGKGHVYIAYRWV